VEAAFSVTSRRCFLYEGDARVVAEKNGSCAALLLADDGVALLDLFRRCFLRW